MTTVTISIMSLDAFKSASAQRTKAALKGRKPAAPRIVFPSEDLLWKVLSPRRFELLKAIGGAGPLGVREIARRLGRDVRQVHADLTALAQASVVMRSAEGKYEFPYDAIHVDFTIGKAA